MVEQKLEKRLNYANKIILAPMVRIGTLPTRLLALRHGADIVYSEEIVDWRLLKTYRQVNDILGTVDYIDEYDGHIVFRTCALEKDKVVLQLGTADAERALQIAKMVENDVAGIDINMGCPKEFSIKGGMGAALLQDPDRAKNILKTLVDNIKIPVTCKIRLLNNVDDTIKLAKEFEAIGISAIAVHGRKKNERPHHANDTEAIRKIAESLTIPVIANGGSRDIDKYEDILKFRKLCGASSCMIARAAEFNYTVFRKQGRCLPLDDVIVEYLKTCVDFDNSDHNSKYCVQRMLRELQDTPRGRKFLECQTLEDICDIWNLGEYCRSKRLEYQEKGMHNRRICIPGKLLKKSLDYSDTDAPDAKRMKSSNLLDDDPIDLITKNIAFFRAHYSNDNLPKTILHRHVLKTHLYPPVYTTKHLDKLFRTIVTFNGKKYASSYWEKNKRFAEQGAALVCILDLGLIDEQTLIKNGSILK